MIANQADYPIPLMADVLGVSVSGFYAFRNRKPSPRTVADDQLADKIAQIHAASRETYGAPRIHAELREQGIRVGKKRVARLMKLRGLQGVHRRKWPVTTKRAERARPAPDLVERQFTADAPDQLWVADITYIPTSAGYLYLLSLIHI